MMGANVCIVLMNEAILFVTKTVPITVPITFKAAITVSLLVITYVTSSLILAVPS
ncbi:MAG: hypothetical protein J6Q86_02940 [Methanobrevibacter sp.]|nr:hypothetical protein [Methanobrevibacter sp.]